MRAAAKQTILNFVTRTRPEVGRVDEGLVQIRRSRIFHVFFFVAAISDSLRPADLTGG